jgi:pyruvate dehydrogenase (quinone)
VGTNFAKIAEGVGISAWRVEKPEDVKSALTTVFAHDGLAVIDVKVARQELSLPPMITAAQAVGFNLYMVKAMLHGNGVDVLDMAKTNLWR